MQVETTFTGFADRAEGGGRLADVLSHYRGKEQTIVVGLPRGGVVTAAAIADRLHLPLDVLIVRKLGAPGHEELAMGAIGPNGVRVLNDEIVKSMRIDREDIEAVSGRERIELERRERKYRTGRPPLDLKGKTVIVVDDGLATGATMSAAIEVVRRHDPARVVLAVPVAPVETLKKFRFVVDELAYLETPEPFGAVGYWYVDFGETEDDEVARLLARSPKYPELVAAGVE